MFTVRISHPCTNNNDNNQSFQHHPRSVQNVTMDRYTPELSMLRLKRRRDDDILSRSHLPRAKKVANTPTGIFDFMCLSAGQYIY